MSVAFSENVDFLPLWHHLQMTYEQIGWSQRCPSQPGRHLQVCGCPSQTPLTHPGIGWHSSQLTPVQPSKQLEKTPNFSFYKSFMIICPLFTCQQTSDKNLQMILLSSSNLRQVKVIDLWWLQVYFNSLRIQLNNIN